MKLLLSLLTLVLLGTNGSAQADSIEENQFQFEGKIINDISLTPHCGFIAWGTVVEFEIIEFSNSKYKMDSIGVILTCPEFYEDGFFEVGNSYAITCTYDNQASFGWTIPNESILAKYNLAKKLWVINAVAIE
jgi:hypothetical protein